jgi:hypothetical protein
MVVNVVAWLSLASSCADTAAGGTTDAAAPAPADGASLHPLSPVNSNRAPAAASATPVQAARSARAEPGLPSGNWSGTSCPARRDGGGPQLVTGRLLATGDGVGAAPIEGVGLAVAPAPVELVAPALALAELDGLPRPKLAAGSAQGDAEMLGVGVADVVGVAVAEVVGVAVAEVVGVAVAEVVGVAVAEVVGVAVADLVGVAGGEQRNGNSAASDAGLLRNDCSSLGKGFVIPVGTTKPGNGPGVAVGELDGVGVAPAGQVSASSRFLTCAWLSSVITVAEACVSCAPGKVAT